MDFDEDGGKETEIGVVTIRDVFLNIDDRDSVVKIVVVRMPSIPTTEDREQLYTDLIRHILNLSDSDKLNDLDSGFEEVFLRKRTTWENKDTRTSRDALLKILQSNRRKTLLREAETSRKPETSGEKKRVGKDGEPPIGAVLSRKEVSSTGAEITLTLKFPLDASFPERRFVYTGFIFNIFYWTMNFSSLSNLLDFEKDFLTLRVAGEKEEAYNLRRGMVSELENGKSKEASSSLKRRRSEDTREPSSSSLRSLQFEKNRELYDKLYRAAVDEFGRPRADTCNFEDLQEFQRNGEIFPSTPKDLQTKDPPIRQQRSRTQQTVERPDARRGDPHPRPRDCHPYPHPHTRDRHPHPHPRRGGHHSDARRGDYGYERHHGSGYGKHGGGQR